MPSRAFALMLCLFAVTLAFADPPMPSSAPDLGPEKYTIHTAAPLRDILPVLTKLTHRQIWFMPLPPASPAAPAKPVDDTPVSLNFDNATLADILASLCKQAGVVYEAPQGSWGSQYPPITLRPGDPAVDGRPVCVLDDYILRVTMISASQNRTAMFHWGSAMPERQAPTSQLQLNLEFLPRTPEAELRFAGLQSHVTAVPDVGKPIETDTRMYGGLQPLQRDSWGRMGRQPLWLTLPIPDPGATVLTRLEGSITCFSEVKVVDIKIPADSEGKTFTQDDVSVTVRTWKRSGGPAGSPQGDNLEIALDATAPPIAHDQRQSWYGRDWQKVTLLTADGRPCLPNSTSEGNTNGKIEIGATFPLNVQPQQQGEVATPLVPTGLQLTFVRCGAADKIIPFVFENVPLP